ncbi:blood group Rh(CE) polypeptide [Bombina bombina]|uniref:blood group Rh(CE) polypeptide n=1 Tax=Bombina bombina TaxID=8345 RepID=UPI00235A9C0F|nr:blood group Rh(CE) polypeptide [Bombina bombina]
MPPRYTPSLRGLLPWLLIFFEIIFILIFLFCFSYDYQSNERYLQLYPAFQDINVMVILGFSYLFAFLKKFGFSGVAFNFLIVVFGLQWAIILDSFILPSNNGLPTISLTSLLTGIMSVFPVLISSGALLGKVNPVQLLLMTVIEVPFFTMNRYVMEKHLKIDGHISMMHGHIFGAYFGLSASWVISKHSLSDEKREKSETISDLFSMLGTMFMWMFWPSYNSVLPQVDIEKKNAIYNTYYSLAVSTVTAFAISILLNRKGKLKMSHVRNASLAGGVSVGFTAYMVQYPWISMTIGLIASLISILALQFLQKTISSSSLLHDTSGVHCTFGLPGLIGGIAYILLILVADWNSILISGYQAMVGVGCLTLTLALSLYGGLLTGFLLNLKILRPPKKWHYFHDQSYWEFPHMVSHL